MVTVKDSVSGDASFLVCRAPFPCLVVKMAENHVDGDPDNDLYSYFCILLHKDTLTFIKGGWSKTTAIKNTCLLRRFSR